MTKENFTVITDDLMREILTAKFNQHPALRDEVKRLGGKAWIETATHRVSDTNWGGRGRDSRFIAALADAFEASTGAVGPTASIAVTDVSPDGKVGLGFSWSNNPLVLQKLRGWARSAPENEADRKSLFIRTMQAGDVAITEAKSLYDLLTTVGGWKRGGNVDQALRTVESWLRDQVDIVRRGKAYREEPDYYIVSALDQDTDFELQDVMGGDLFRFNTPEEAQSWIDRNGFTGRTEIIGDFDVEPGQIQPDPGYERLSVNKGRGEYQEWFIRGKFPVPGQHGSFTEPNLLGWFRVRKMSDGQLDVQEVQSELFQKNKGGFAAFAGTPRPSELRIQQLISAYNETPPTDTAERSRLERQLRVLGVEDVDAEVGGAVVDNPTVFTTEQAAFLNLLLNNQTWVPVFTNAITQWARTQGYQKVRFPTGETAARVEGHQVLADRLTALQAQKTELQTTLGAWFGLEDRPGEAAITFAGRTVQVPWRRVAPLLRIERRRLEQGEASREQWELAPKEPPLSVEDRLLYTEFAKEFGLGKNYIPTETAIQALMRSEPALMRLRSSAPIGVPGQAVGRFDAVAERVRVLDAENKIKQIDAEIQQLKTQGIEKLAPIEAFYENRIGSIVNRLGATRVTDANGNTWREVSVTPTASIASTTRAFAAGVATTLAVVAGRDLMQGEPVVPPTQEALATAQTPEQVEAIKRRQLLRDTLMRWEEGSTNKMSLKAYEDKGFDGSKVTAVGPGFRMYDERDGIFEAVTGANFRQVKAGLTTLNEKQYFNLLDHNINVASANVRQLNPELDRLPIEVQAQLVQLEHWNVFKKFRQFRDAVISSEWALAAAELRDSELYRKGGSATTRLETAASVLDKYGAEVAAPVATPSIATVVNRMVFRRAEQAVYGRVLSRDERSQRNKDGLPTEFKRELDRLNKGPWANLRAKYAEANMPKTWTDSDNVIKSFFARSKVFPNPVDRMTEEERNDLLNLSREKYVGKRMFESMPLFRPAVLGVTDTETRNDLPASAKDFSASIASALLDATYSNPAYQRGTPAFAQLQDEYKKILEYQVWANQIYDKWMSRYGLTRGKTLYRLVDGGKRLERTDVRMTEADLQAVQDFMWIPTSLMENAMFRAEVARLRNVHRGDRPALMQAVLKLIARRRADKVNPDQIVWGDAYYDVFGNPVTHIENFDDAMKRWELANNTTREKLVSAGAVTGTWDEEIAGAILDVSELYDTAKKDFNISSRVIGYIPHIFGGGRVGRAAQEAIDRLEKAIDSARASDPSWLGRQKEYDRDFNGEAPMPTSDQITAYKDAVKRHTDAVVAANPLLQRQDDQALKSVLEDIANGQLTMWDLNQMILSELVGLHKLLAKDPAYSPTTDVLKKDVSTIKNLRKTLSGYPNREWTSRAFARKNPDASYADLYRASKGRLKPNTMNLFDTVHAYVNDVTAGRAERTVLKNIINQVDVDGAPLVIAVPSQFYDKQPLFATDALENMLGNVQSYFRQRPSPQQQNIRPAVIAAVANMDKSNYIRMESPYPSVGEFWVLKGEAHQIMKHLVQPERKLFIGGVDTMKVLTRFAQWSKITSVGWSIFFPFALLESVIAGTGIRNNVLWDRNGKFAPFTGFKDNLKEIMSIARESQAGFEGQTSFIRLLARHGVELGHKAPTDQATTIVDVDRQALIDRTRRNSGETAAKVMGTFLNLWTKGPSAGKLSDNQPLSDFMFNTMFPAMKVWAAKRLADTLAAEKTKVKGTTFDSLPAEAQEEIASKIAPIINDAYGGQFWKRYLWANPRTLQYLNLFMFAPNWTLSAWNIAGGGILTSRLLGNYMTKENADFVFKTNWPAMYVIVLLAIPTALQLAMTAAGAAFGDGDPDDKWIASFNETNRGGLFPYVDVTPVARMFPWYEGDPTGQRRVYMRFGKQAYEVLDGWLTEPVAQLARKLSQPAKVVLEQVTGKSPGSDWNLEFNGQGFIGWLKTDKEGADAFLTSRAGYLLTKFIPMSFLTLMENPEVAAAAFIAPVSKGMSLGRGTEELIKVFNTYADDKAWFAVEKNPKARRNLEALAPALVDALERNGYDADKAINTAKGVVLSKLYKKFWTALDGQDTEEMNKLAERILRVGGSAKGLKTSLSNRRSQVGQPELTAEEVAQIEETFR